VEGREGGSEEVGDTGTFCRAATWPNQPDPLVLDTGMLSIDVDVIRITLHVLAATIWVGGQIVLAALVGPLRRVGPDAVSAAAKGFARVGWPAFGVLIVTGIWNIVVSDNKSDAYQTTLMVKLTFAALSGVGAALHTSAKSPALKGIWASVGLIGALAAVLFGVSIVEAG
jgi:putative copper export protein